MVEAGLAVEIQACAGAFKLDVSLQLGGGLLVITGPSGSGKSTLLNCIAGLKNPLGGRIVCGQQVFFDSAAGINIAPQRRSCGYVLQNLALFPHLNLAANICYGIEHWPRAKKQDRLSSLLRLVKLEGLAERSISQLSGGQLQRVALARALAPEPGLLLLDEPFTALDPELREELGLELKVLQQELAIPVLLVTHSRAEAMRLGDTAVLLENGRVAFAGAACELGSAKSGNVLGSSVKFSW